MANTSPVTTSQPVHPVLGDLVITRRPLRYRPAFDPEADTRALVVGTLGIVANRVQGQRTLCIDFGGFSKYVAEADLAVIEGPLPLKQLVLELEQRVGESVIDIFQAQRRVIIQCQAQADYYANQVRNADLILNETVERMNSLIAQETSRADGLQAQVVGLQAQLDQLTRELGDLTRAASRLHPTAKQ